MPFFLLLLLLLLLGTNCSFDFQQTYPSLEEHETSTNFIIIRNLNKPSQPIMAISASFPGDWLLELDQASTEDLALFKSAEDMQINEVLPGLYITT